ncbi:hypothetical protein L2735_10495 [Shewanella olleyana]|uniref:hypothetical protein n=1 Tax=Shewanella olleyana TaxID=135626 RepID=UPI00200C22DB|nr:hypothetical protein [Shewanella olleyana]MCL1067236.1 hypothetical protein [Shewanella olleyana]
MINKVKLSRAWASICIKYPIFQIFSSNRIFSLVIFLVYLKLLTFSILWTFGIPQKLLGITVINGVPDGLFSGVIEISILIFLGISLLVWKTLFSSSESEKKRRTCKLDGVSQIDVSKRKDFHIYPIDEKVNISLSFDYKEFYNFPSILDASYKWIALDRDELFLVEAGSLDIPKLTLKTLKYDKEDNSLKVELGAASFYDIFYTHYSPDLLISSQSANESNNSTSLRSLYEHSILKYYEEADNLFYSSGVFTPLSLLPNPIGISGIVIINTPNGFFVILRRRGEHEILDRNRIEWSFAGLIEATDWVHTKTIPFTDFAYSELNDEVTKKLPILEEYTPKISTIGFVLNPDCLYQPELFVTVEYQLNNNLFCVLKRQLDRKPEFCLIQISQLEDKFKSAEKIKSLCFSGLELLKQSSFYPIQD